MAYPAQDDDVVLAYSARTIIKAFPPLQKPQLSRTQRKDKEFPETDTGEIKDALTFLTAKDYLDDYDWWWKFGIAIYRELGDDGFEIWNTWARNSSKYDEDAALKKWQSFERAHDTNPITVGTIFEFAKREGWERLPRHRLATIDEVELPETILSLERIEETALKFAVNIEKWDEGNEAEFLTRMNREHAVVTMGGQVRYMHRTLDEDGNPITEFMRAEDMQNHYAAIQIPNRLGSVPEFNSSKFNNGFKLWNHWPKRKHYQGIGLFPGSKPVPSGFLNLWTGFAIAPLFDENRCGLLLDHIEDNICEGDEKLFTWLLDWLAHCVQKPDDKPGSAVVLASPEKGTGKSTIIKVMTKIFGSHALTVSKSSQYTGRFNAHLKNCIFLGMEEATWGGDKQAEGALKDLITNDRITIEAKGRDAVSMRNYTRILITSNEKWFVPAGIEERRFFVARVKPVKKNMTKRDAYFRRIYEQLDDGGYEAFLGYLLERQITSNLFTPPDTGALIEQKRQSLSGIERWVIRIAQDGAITTKDATHELKEGEIVRVPKEACRESAMSDSRSIEHATLNQAIGGLLAKLNVDGSQKMKKGAFGRQPAYDFPPLEEFRAAVSDMFGALVEFASTTDDNGTS